MSSAVDSRPTLDEKASYGDDKPELEKTVAADVYAVDSDDDEGTCIRWRPRRQLLTFAPSGHRLRVHEGAVWEAEEEDWYVHVACILLLSLTSSQTGTCSR